MGTDNPLPDSSPEQPPALPSGVSNMVATIIESLKRVDESIDWQGRPNWTHIGSKTHCWRCGKEFGKGIEPGSDVRHHIIPRSEGARGIKHNLALLCGSCHDVVHKRYLPTDRIGKKRTREGSWRSVAEFSDGIRINKLVEAADGSLGRCGRCGTPGAVDGVTESYWDGQGMLVCLTCPKCGAKFAEPFIAAKEPPELSPEAVLAATLEAAFFASARRLPPELAARVRVLGSTLAAVLRDTEREIRAAVRRAQRAELAEEHLREQIADIRAKHAESIESMLPDIADLEQACKAYQRGNPAAPHKAE